MYVLHQHKYIIVEHLRVVAGMRLHGSFSGPVKNKRKVPDVPGLESIFSTGTEPGILLCVLWRNAHEQSVSPKP
jgi:hypothetical protein